ncbi:UNVERIFIED_ORG: sporulation protein Spo0E [Clostridium botulinum]
MELLKQKLYRYINLYGVTNPETVKISQQLDQEIIKEQRRIIYEC